MVPGRADRLRGLLPLGDIALGAPDPGELPVLYHTHHVIDEPVGGAVAVEFPGLEVAGPIAAPNKLAEELLGARVRHVEGAAESRADQLARVPASVHPHHGLVD